MAKKYKAGMSDLVKEGLDAFAECEDHYKSEYQRGKEDLDFTLGIDQWPPEIASSRRKTGRPCLTENRMLPFVNQVVNDIRQSRPSVQVKPVDDSGDIETAKILQGMIRNIEYQSDANTVYDTAAWNAITTGYGWIRINTKYADEESFRKEIEILRVPNFESVMIDPNSKEVDGSDAEYGFVFVDMPRDKFKALYPKANPVNFQDYSGTNWSTDKTVRIAERFYKTYTDKEIVMLADGTIVDASKAQGLDVIASRTVRQCKVKWCKMTGAEVVEETDWNGIYIPLVPVFGLEAWVDGTRRCYSLVNQAKDPQRRLNYWLSASTEIIALQPKAPYLGLEGAFRGNQQKWDSANVENHAYLEFSPVELPDGSWATTPPMRQQVPVGAPAMTQEMMFAADGIKSTLGLFNASLGASGNETSGKAIIARQAEGDNATFHFSDNLANAIRQVGRILVDLIPKEYDGAQIVRTLGEDDSEKLVPVNQVVVKNGENYSKVAPNAKGELMKIDLSAGKYDVVCMMGPSYATKRLEAATAMVEMARAAPQILEVAGDLIVKNMDWPGAQEIADRLRKVLPPNLQPQDDENPEQAALMQAGAQIQEMQAVIQQLDAALKAKQEDFRFEQKVEMEKIDLEKQKLQIEAAKTAAEIAKMQAETQQAIPAEAIATVLQTISELQAGLGDVRDAVDMILSHEEEKSALDNSVVESVPSGAVNPDALVGE